MNIKKAKEQIRIAMRAYFSKDEFGHYKIPVARQRPVFLMGPPGIGKTAIMEQIANELNVGLVSYSMTHHTRQSALGLPFIEHKIYGGQEYAVSEYTMSEIIASVYETMEATGVKEGILFLDEINCVSETLAPSMLQFLQYKVFGRHRVPDGWIVVTAGNPPEYNRSVREFDIVTWDRLKRIDVEPDFDAWKEYAYLSQVHPAVMTYLEAKRDDFYQIETTVDGKNFVTARGWSDLSEMIRLCEETDETPDEDLIRQYLQNPRIAKDFANYYDLFRKYRSDYQVGRILDGTVDKLVKMRAKKAKFDERLSLLGLILDALSFEFKDICVEERAIVRLFGALKEIRGNLDTSDENMVVLLKAQQKELDKEVSRGIKASNLSADDRTALERGMKMLEQITQFLIKNSDANDLHKEFALVRKEFDAIKTGFHQKTTATGSRLSNAFCFCEDVFGAEGNEILILVTELTVNAYSSSFIGKYGCQEYFDHNQSLLFYERQKTIISELEALEQQDLDD